jgi:hypothetical protein
VLGHLTNMITPRITSTHFRRSKPAESGFDSFSAHGAFNDQPFLSNLLTGNPHP